MKITKNQLSRIIKEELQRVILEQSQTPKKDQAVQLIVDKTSGPDPLGTQGTINLVTNLIGKLNMASASGGDEESLWEEVISFFGEGSSDLSYEEEEGEVVLTTPSQQDISTLRKKLKLPADEDWDTVGGKPRIWE